MTRYAPIPRAAAERLVQLRRIRDRADIEAGGILGGLCWALGIDLASIVGVDDGDLPALLLADIEPAAGYDSPMTDESTTPQPTDQPIESDGGGSEPQPVAEPAAEPESEEDAAG